MFRSLLHKVVQALYLKPPAVKRPRAIGLDDEGNALRPSAISAEFLLCPEDRLQLVYRAEATPLVSEDKSSMKKRTPSSSFMMTGRQGTKVIKTP